MTILGHTAIGLAIGTLTHNPVLGFAAGVVSHHIADAVPHFDPGSFIPKHVRETEEIHPWGRREVLMVGIDLLLTFGLIAFAIDQIGLDQWPIYFWSILGANFPDVVHNVPFWNHQLLQIDWVRWWREKIHRRFQWTVEYWQWPFGVTTQLVTIVIALWLIVRTGGGL